MTAQVATDNGAVQQATNSAKAQDAVVRTDSQSLNQAVTALNQAGTALQQAQTNVINATNALATAQANLIPAQAPANALAAEQTVINNLQEQACA